MEYRGYVGTVQYSEADRVLHGQIAGIRDSISYEAMSVDDLEIAFHEAVDDYLALCAKRGEAPEKPFSGKFVLRTTPDVHRAAVQAAAREGKSLNAWAESVITAVAGAV